MTTPDECFARIKDAKVMSKLDCTKGFFQIELDLKSRNLI